MRGLRLATRFQRKLAWTTALGWLDDRFVNVMTTALPNTWANPRGLLHCAAFRKEEVGLVPVPKEQPPR